MMENIVVRVHELERKLERVNDNLERIEGLVEGKREKNQREKYECNNTKDEHTK